MLRSFTRCCLLTALALLIGCNGKTETPTTTPTPAVSKESATEEFPHVHDDADQLVWALKEKIDGTEFEIWYGHHGKHFHRGEGIEPAVAIMLGGEPFADAKVFNAVVDPADQGKLMGEELEVVYESETEEEIAHYAQGDLVIPEAGTACVIRFRIVLPDHDEEITRDVKVKVAH